MDRKIIGVICFFLCSLNCFSQEQAKEYKVIKIDSTESSYIIFLSSDLLETGFSINVPSLSKNDDNRYTISQYDRNTIRCLLSPKINGLNRNVYVNKIYELSLNCIKEVSVCHMCYTHIGYGDYLLQLLNDELCTTKEMAGLLYTQNSDSIKYFSYLLHQNGLFDNNMLKIWMRFSHSELSYPQWLNKQINEVKDVYFDNCNDTIILYQDENCKIPYTEIVCKDYCENNTLKAKLFYKYKKNSFVKFDNNLYPIWGWIRNSALQIAP